MLLTVNPVHIKVCRRCEQKFTWTKRDSGGFQMVNLDGTPHLCTEPKAAPLNTVITLHAAVSQHATVISEQVHKLEQQVQELVALLNSRRC